MVVIGVDVLSRAIQMWSVEPRLGGGTALHAAIGLGSLLLLASFVRSSGGEEGKPGFLYNISVLLTLLIASLVVGMLSFFIDEYEGRLNYSAYDPVLRSSQTKIDSVHSIVVTNIIAVSF